jgi:low affinity Fe/Cu permease
MLRQPDEGEVNRMDRFFTSFATVVARWTGSHWAFTIAGVVVLVSLASVGVEGTNIAVSVATLLMVFVLQNTQNRDSAALHLKLDEMIHAEPAAREDLRGVELKPEAEIQSLTLDDEATSASASREAQTDRLNES